MDEYFHETDSARSSAIERCKGLCKESSTVPKVVWIWVVSVRIQCGMDLWREIAFQWIMAMKFFILRMWTCDFLDCPSQRVEEIWTHRGVCWWLSKLRGALLSQWKTWKALCIEWWKIGFETSPSWNTVQGVCYNCECETYDQTEKVVQPLFSNVVKAKKGETNGVQV